MDRSAKSIKANYFKEMAEYYRGKTNNLPVFATNVLASLSIPLTDAWTYSFYTLMKRYYDFRSMRLYKAIVEQDVMNRYNEWRNKRFGSRS